jgi:hypothetical protein
VDDRGVRRHLGHGGLKGLLLAGRRVRFQRGRDEPVEVVQFFLLPRRNLLCHVCKGVWP